MLQQRNLILAIVLSMAVLFGFEYFFGAKQPPMTAQQQDSAQMAASSNGQMAAPSSVQAPGQSPVAAPQVPAQPGAAVPTPGGMTPGAASLSREEALAADISPRIGIDTARLHGSIRLRGARIDDLSLVDYRETVDPQSPEISLLSPPGAPLPYYAEFGWVAGTPGVKVPDADTLWQADRGALGVDAPVTLTWDNGEGLRFIRRIAIDRDFMFSITQAVENIGAGAVTLFPYGLVSRINTPALLNYYILHEGPLGVFDGTLKEVKYSALKDDGEVKHTSTGGWMGITDKYWLTALVTDQSMPVTGRFLYQPRDGRDGYQADFLGAAFTVEPGGRIETSNHLFSGAKEVKLLDRYTDELGIKNFDLAIDFGWFYFMTKPFFLSIQFLHGILGNMGLAILAFTVVLKLVFFPLANKSYRSMSKMKLLQPELKKLQERFKDDRARLNQEMMSLYKKEQVNPLSGCLPIVIQIPVFFALYKVLFVSIEMRHEPFYGWIRDLAAPDPTTIFNLFGLIPWDPPNMLMLGAWPLIMGVTMWMQQKLNPTPADPTQAKIMMFLPIMFTFMLAHFAAGLVIYWTWNNLLSITQQWVIMKRMGAKT
ncbi:membrane protein insertase YidC [Rhodospirillum rubrum]|uniref:membrane protein insertase YidC n=1 Tax=Rhodospirillum rubrum TaxID=1085 RepID=UPI001908BE63|nr:membrane protein insertase YidC [Rhodospirillum rubrum]MBK1664518.1 membrane protein insertase YidC [Rhodospirillum rubrum]MBK1676227.1 membrane protein insertase YidC [Rhodospirillum rubrum]